MILTALGGGTLYFLEPCFNINTCQWTSIYDACFFSVVTSVTVGYGNQTPQLFYTRIISIILVLLGRLLTAMPLAIIIRAYNSSWELCRQVASTLHDARIKKQGNENRSAKDIFSSKNLERRSSSALANLDKRYKLSHGHAQLQLFLANFHD